MRHYIRQTVCCLCLLACCMGTVAQKINADGSVTFSFVAPKADRVEVEGSFDTERKSILNKVNFVSNRRIKMTKEGDTWTYTTKPLASDMYTYHFIVDKENFSTDPNNPNTVRDIADTLNYFFIEGALAERLKDKDVPHGTVEKIWYPSTLNGMSQRRMFIYLPAEYADNPEKHYPVLYLLHGSGGDETAWTDFGRARQILDNMIASGEVEPLIVVMPNGNVELDAAPGESPYMDKKPSGNNVNSMFGLYEASFDEEIMKYTEKHYRTINDKQHRAIAGLSLGGLHTIYISCNNPQTFGYVGLFSPQASNMLNDKRINQLKKLKDNARNFADGFAIMFGYNPRIKAINKVNDIDIYKNLEEKLAKQFSPSPSLYYIAIGRDDFVMKLVDDFRMTLDMNKYKYTYNLTEGGHSWENWRRYLIDFLPKLYK